jgi:hypothetical protein
MEPDPSERFLSPRRQGELALLRKRMAEMLAEQERRAAKRAQVAAAANAIHPGATDLVRAAAADPDVTPQNAMSWFRSKLPSVSAETKEMLVHALGVLFLAALNAAAQNAISQQEAAAAAPATWWESLPTTSEVRDAMRSYPNLRGGTRAPCANESVVDAVFAKAERKTGGR